MRFITKFANGKYLSGAIFNLQEDFVKSILKKDYYKFTEENTSKYIALLSNDIKFLEKNPLLQRGDK